MAAVLPAVIPCSPPRWQRWLNWDRSAMVRQHAALHVEMQHEQWIVDEGEMSGYSARARILKSRWDARL